MSPVNSLWFKWKSLRLPWRRSFLIGYDLYGNSFWEFKDVVNTNRFRRIVKYNRKAHYADVKIPPQWHQWLRYVREHPPSVQEQQEDLLRQVQLKKLAQLADERWASQPSYLDPPQDPRVQQSSPATKPTGDTREMMQNQNHYDGVEKNAATTTLSSLTKREDDRENNFSSDQSIAPPRPTKSGVKNPWVSSDRSGPSEKWQPESWTPSVTRR